MTAPVEARHSLSSLEQAQGALNQIRQRFRLEEAKAESRSTFFDSFDWRLHQSGLVLSELQELAPRRSQRLTLLGPSGRTLGFAVGGLRAPATSDALPPGALRDRVANALDCRALLPLVAAHRRGRVCRVIDKRDKTVARIAVETVDVRHPSARWRRLGAQLRLIPVRGYEEVDEAISRWLLEAGIERAEEKELDWLLRAIGRRPEDVSSKLDVELAPTERADVAIRRLLARTLEVVRLNEDGVRRAIDPEFLHDFRVSVRRSRSLLSHAKEVFPQRVRKRYLEGLRWLQRSTGHKRDLDVFLLEIPRFREMLGTEHAETLAALEARLREQAAEEQEKLVRLLASARYRRLVDGWERFATSGPPARTRLGNAARPISEVAAERIWRVYRRVLKRGRRIRDDTPAPKIHSLRLEAKRLRYLLESFRSLYPPRLEMEIRSLKRLQNVLGRFNDYEVQQRELRSSARELRASGVESTVDALVARLQKLRAKERKKIEPRFERFSKRKHRKAYTALFHHREPSAK